MDVLLDTHLAYWYLRGDERIPRLAKELILDRSNCVFVSLASAWEIGIKHGKHPEAMPMTADDFIEGCKEVGFVVLPIVEDQILDTMKVQTPTGLAHQDPFDRFLLGTASAMKLRFLTADRKIGLYSNPYILTV